MPKVNRLSIVVPVYNERENVVPLLAEIQQALSGNFTYEIVYVDDGSNDGTRELLLQLQETVEPLRVVCHFGNFGQSIGLITGVQQARYEWIATLDGDGQNDPADIPELIAQIEAIPEAEVLAAGNRVNRNDSNSKLFSSKVANALRGWLLQDDCPDTGCGIKVFPRDVFLRVPHFNHVHRFLPALFKREDIRVINVPVNHRPRTRGVSKYGMLNRAFVGIIDLFGVAWLIKRKSRAQLTTDV